MKNFFTFIVIVLTVGSCSNGVGITNEEIIDETKVKISVDVATGKTFTYSLGSLGRENSIGIFKQAESYNKSEIEIGDRKDVKYIFEPKKDFKGLLIVKIGKCTSHNGSECLETKEFEFNITVV